MARNDIFDNIKKYKLFSLVNGLNFLAPVTTLFYLGRGLSYKEIFLIYAVIVISMFLFEVPTGMIGDKYGRKTSVMIGIAGMMLSTILLYTSITLTAFIIAMAVLGIALTFISGSDEALIYDSLKQCGREKEMRKHSAEISALRMLPILLIAPISAYIARDLTEPQFMILFACNFIVLGLGLLIISTLVEPKVETGPHEIRSPIILLKISLKHIKDSPTLVRLFLNKTLVLIPGIHLFNMFWQPYLTESGVPVIFLGVFVSIASLIIFIISRNIDRIERHLSRKKMLFCTGMMPAIAFLAGAFSRSIIIAIVFYFVVKILIWFRDPIFSHYMNKNIHSHNRATVLSSLSMIDSLLDVVIFLSAGFITDIGMEFGFVFAGIVILAGLSVFRIGNRVDSDD